MSDSSSVRSDRPLVLRYPIVSLALALGIVGGVLWLLGFDAVVRWGFGGYAVAIAVLLVVGR